VPRTYTVDEANLALAEVRQLVDRIVELAPTLPEMEEQVRIQRLKNNRAGETEESQEALAQAAASLRSTEMAVAVAVQRLEAMEVTIKGPLQYGLVDFLSYRDGELVELCWQLGEETVAHWHRIGEGYPGRKPL
jgi:hypothetical protein